MGASLIDVLKTKLESKGFNIDGLSIRLIDDNEKRNIEVKKIITNSDGIDIPMTIILVLNEWGGRKVYSFLELDDFYILRAKNGDNEQKVRGIVPQNDNESREFMSFIKKFLGNDNVFYVQEPTAFWESEFIHKKIPHRNMIVCLNKQGGGSKRRKSKRRKSKRKSKRRKSRTRRRSR